jgi:hypothetical protein
MLVTPKAHPAATTAADELQAITARKTCSAGRLRKSAQNDMDHRLWKPIGCYLFPFLAFNVRGNEN